MKENKKREIIAADFETFITENNGANEHVVYAIGWQNIYSLEKEIIYIEKNDDVWYSSFELISTFMDSLFKMKSPIVYFHNMSGFDGIFILKWAKLHGWSNKVKILSRDSIILKIKILNVEFRDSYRIMPSSLDSLAKSLLNESKLDFNHGNINCIEDCLNMKDKVEKYLTKDVDILSRVIRKSSKNLFNEFNVSLFDHLTTASLSLAIYKLTNKKYIESIEQSKDEKDKFIRKGYNGGLCNLMFPDLKNGYHYDVNSLYPFIMSTCKMPIGEGFWVNSINNFEEIKDMFGFIEVEVKTEYPCLAVDYNNKGLITPIGKFSGTFFSEELKFALKNGCEIIKFKKALVFKEKRVIFKKFINHIYSKRIQAKKRKNRVNEYNLKLIMNSLYGRFGLGTDLSILTFINNEDYPIYEYIYKIVQYNSKLGFLSFTIEDIDKSKSLFNIWCSNERISGKDKDELFKKIIGKHLNNSSAYRAVQISAAISSYARIKMMEDIRYCEKLNIKVHYIDTDSLFVDKPLPEDMVSKIRLGYYKLESEIDEGVFLAPKAYAYKNGDKEIIKLKGIEKDKEITGYVKLDYDAVLNIRCGIVKSEPNKKWEFGYTKPVYRVVNKLMITNKEQNLKLGFQSYKFKRIFNKDGVWVGCEPPRLN